MAADYVFWRKNALPPEQYDEWRANFGATAASGSGAASLVSVPEPIGLVTALIAAMIATLLLEFRKKRMPCHAL